eukprot:1156747-Pelagomonas_calceolata.AAC.3
MLLEPSTPATAQEQGSYAHEFPLHVLITFDMLLYISLLLPTESSAPAVPPTSLSLSMLPTTTDQWQADKTLYYSPVSCTSSMAPHKFPATLREGMLLYFRPMQREQVLESMAHTNARGDEQAAAGAESFQASLQDAGESSRPSARALELFKLAGAGVGRSSGPGRVLVPVLTMFLLQDTREALHVVPVVDETPLYLWTRSCPFFLKSKRAN